MDLGTGCKDCRDHSGVCQIVQQHESRIDSMHGKLGNAALQLQQALQQLKDREEDTAAMTKTVKDLCETVAELQQDRKTGASIRSFWGPVLVGVLAVIAQVVIAVVKG